MKTPEQIQSELACPFPASDVEWRPGNVSEKEGRTPAALAFPYIDARAVVARLDQAVGIDGWQSDHFAVGDKQIACKIGIRFGERWVWKSDGTYVGNLESAGTIDAKEEGRLEMEGKGSFSGALKRAAVSWGIGRYLYDIDPIWADVERKGRSFVFSRSGLAKLDGIADKLYRAANPTKAGRMPTHSPPDDDVPPARSADASPPTPRSDHGRAADAAVTAQVKGPVGVIDSPPPRKAPANDIAPDPSADWVKLAAAMKKVAATTDADLSALYNQLLQHDRNGMPKALRKSVLSVILRSAFETTRDEQDLEWLNGWREIGISADLDPEVDMPVFMDALNEAKRRTGWKASA